MFFFVGKKVKMKYHFSKVINTEFKLSSNKLSNKTFSEGGILKIKIKIHPNNESNIILKKFKIRRII